MDIVFVYYGERMFVDEVMTKKVITIEQDKSAWDACHLYSNHKIGCLVVTKNGQLDGIVTERDIIHRIINQNKNPQQITIGEIMSDNIISIHPTADINEAVELMSINKIKKLPVIEDKGNLVGIITITDLANVVPDFMKILREIEQTENEETNDE